MNEFVLFLVAMTKERFILKLLSAPASLLCLNNFHKYGYNWPTASIVQGGDS